jgi:hypothetical protein
VSEKSNEIVAIPALLDMMSIEGSVVMIDAMGCQRDIATKIIEKRVDYIVALKGSQGTSPTISPERLRARIPSASGAKPQDGTTNISPTSSRRDCLHPIPLEVKRALCRVEVLGIVVSPLWASIHMRDALLAALHASRRRRLRSSTKLGLRNEIAVLSKQPRANFADAMSGGMVCDFFE